MLEPLPDALHVLTAEAVRLAILSHRCHDIIAGLPPHDNAPPEARAVARALAQTLDLLTIPRGGRPPAEARALEARATALAAWLVEMGMVPAG